MPRVAAKASVSPAYSGYVAYADGRVWLRPAVWDLERACALAAPYVRREQVEAYLPSGESPKACELS